MTREEILKKAMECVCGQREQDYGSPEDNFKIIADLWNAYLGDIYISDNTFYKRKITELDVSMMMSLLKIARVRGSKGNPTEDCLIDLAGYAACGGEICTKHSD